MSDKTVLVMPGSKKRLSVPKPVKRSMQVAVAVTLTSLVVLALVLGNALLMAKGTSMQGVNAWLAFIKRGDIQATMILTAVVTVLFVYWQRDQEKR